MKINRVTLFNFSSYVGENTIVLDTHDEQNIILIGGNNGAGKTSFFTAIKLALYGPQCFRFQDKNNRYTARIKELINHDAFLSNNVKAYVEVEIDLPTDRTHTLYTIRREWSFVEKRLHETYSVYKDQQLLADKNLDFFQNYLFSVIPPNLFDFFFFDGEEIGDFFATGNYSTYIKNAVLTLSGYDTFNIIQKFCDSYIGEEGNEDYDQVAKLVEQEEANLFAYMTKSSALESQKQQLTAQLLSAQEEKESLDYQFSRSGGLTAKEQERLEAQRATQERVKGDKAKRIRDFVESMMPLYITKDLAAAAYKQLKDEQFVRQYHTICDLLDAQTIQDVLEQQPNCNTAQVPALAQAISNGIAKKVLPSFPLESFTFIHDLSQEQESQVVSDIVRTQHFAEVEAPQLIKAIAEKKKASQKYEEISKKIREALPSVDAAAYFEKVRLLTERIAAYEDSLENRENQIAELETNIADQKALGERLRKALFAKAKDRTAHEFTARISQVMQRMISDATQEKFHQIESLALEMFNKIIRKENFVQLIELDENFNVNLYKKQVYTTRELLQLANNIGLDALEKRLGSTGLKEAARLLTNNSINELRRYFSEGVVTDQISFQDDIELPLYNRVELNQLSKGEKQVFILSLYWAIIKTSNQAVPFIIDTPFARIDTEHREQISALFFPNISGQVIILSTDEEVVGSYREIIQPHIAHEYLLEYNVEKGCTSVQPGYFKEEKA
ncbi:AAA family ATPase [Fournierella sp.]|uniref:AAA family ATPase n=1 Tax=Allofournierella sp. TaxID=1940256 RepID=UPI00307AFAE4